MITFYALKSGRLSAIASSDATESIPENTVWLDLAAPTREEEKLAEQFLSIEIPTRDEMQEIEASSRLYTENDGLVMTMSVLGRAVNGEPSTSAITFILSPKGLVTVRYIEPVPFTIFIQKLNRQPLLATSAEQALIGLLEQIADCLADILESATAELEDLSLKIFRKQEEAEEDLNFTEAINRIGHTGNLSTKAKGSLLNLSRLLLFFNTKATITDDSRDRIKTLMQDAGSIDEHARFLSAKVSFLLDATLGLINLEQNKIIKIFSVAAVAFLPPTLIASIYGMNFEFLPELKWTYGYPFAIGLMILSAIIPFMFFRHKKWL